MISGGEKKKKNHPYRPRDNRQLTIHKTSLDITLRGVSPLSPRLTDGADDADDAAVVEEELHQRLRDLSFEGVPGHAAVNRHLGTDFRACSRGRIVCVDVELVNYFLGCYPHCKLRSLATRYRSYENRRKMIGLEDERDYDDVTKSMRTMNKKCHYKK